MLGTFFLLLTLAARQDPPPTSPVVEAPAPKDELEPSEARALAEYAEVRDKTPSTASAQWKLALWCEKVGLKPEALIHLGRVIELDPNREAAWQKLGFKKNNGRWMTPDQIAADEASKKAEKSWLSQLAKWHKDIHGGKKQPEAQAALDAITDKSAISAIYREFGGGGARDQEIAIQMFGQIESPVASKTLAMLAVYGKTPNVRRLATETIRGRDPREYLDVLVGLMKDLLKFEVRPVGGPGSPGVLFVEGERFNIQRFYAPPLPPNVSPRPGDVISYDALGMPVITRPIATLGLTGGPTSTGTTLELDQAVEFSYSRAMIEARKGAVAAQSQLSGDVARIESINAERDRFNQLVMNVARDASGKSPGETPKAWRDFLDTREGRYASRPRTRRIPTIDELVPAAYVPVFAQATFLVRPVIDH